MKFAIIFLGAVLIQFTSCEKEETTVTDIDGNGTDDYGFNALPGGSRAYSFDYMGRASYWWAR